VTLSQMEDAHARVTMAAERELYGQAIQLAEGDQSKAAKWLGVSRPTMREKLLRYGLHPTQDSKPERVAEEPASRTPVLDAN
jgi:DNA-binding NtrC family response regulator